MEGWSTLADAKVGDTGVHACRNVSTFARFHPHPQHSILSEFAVGDIADKLKEAMVEALSKVSPDVKKKLMLQVRG